MSELTSGQGQTYDQVVNYGAIDPFKVSASEAAASTAHNLGRFGYRELDASRGESSFAWDMGETIMAGVVEGLGTKNLVADAVQEADDTIQSFYGAIAQDSIAMIANDLIVNGADPMLYWVHVAAGESDWFADEKRAKAFNLGSAAVCNSIGVTWAGGESPALPGIILPGASEISGFMLGEISPKNRYVPGNKITEGDAIILVESSGIHANGLSAARKLADSLPNGYETKLPNGQTFGETLLTPTNLYVDLVQGLLDNGFPIHRFENITGHGWRKIMRAREDFTYVINQLPEAMPIFNFLQKKLEVDDTEMFGNYNMGAGFAIYAPEEDAEDIITESINVHGLHAWRAGWVENGTKQVVIMPKNIVFSGDSLGVRK